MPPFGLVLLLAVAQATPGTAPDPLVATLERETQALLDALGRGDKAKWDKLLAPDLVYVSEDGTIKNKAQLLEEVSPLPKGIAGTIEVKQFKLSRHGDTAIATYVSEEMESYYGQSLHASYRSTDTWMSSPSGWKLIASQVLALRTDPPVVPLSPAQEDAYVGTYQLTPEITYTIRREGNGLSGQRKGRPATKLEAELVDVFFVPGDYRIRKIFQRGPDQRVTGFLERRESWDVHWKRMDDRK
jgi:hypothetical protein